MEGYIKNTTYSQITKRTNNDKYETVPKFIQEFRPNLNNKSETNIEEQFSEHFLKIQKHPP